MPSFRKYWCPNGCGKKVASTYIKYPNKYKKKICWGYIYLCSKCFARFTKDKRYKNKLKVINNVKL